MKTATQTIADKINDHLEAGGVVQVTTYLKSILYTKKHVGWFQMIGDNLYVNRGRTKDCLSLGGKVIVGIKFGTYK